MDAFSTTTSNTALLQDAVYCYDLAQAAEAAYDVPMAMAFYQEAYYGYEAAGAMPEATAVLKRVITMMDNAFR